MNQRLLGSFTVALAALFAGAAIYITLVEQPARLVLDNRSLLLQWQNSYPLALRMQAPLAIATGLAGLWTWWLARGWRWILGAVLILANLPFTLTMLAPINNELTALAPDAAGPGSRALIEQWGTLHAVRSGLGILATVVFVWAHNHRQS